MAWAVATCLFWAAVLSITFPRMVSLTCFSHYQECIADIYTSWQS